MKNIKLDKQSTEPTCNKNFVELERTINEMIIEIDELKSRLSRVHKDRPDPRTDSPYDLNRSYRP